MMDSDNNKTSNSKEKDIPNIVVWLDFDAYAYITFGIITELSKLGKFNFIGIVTTKQDMEFFQKQRIVPFKKLIYYPECYINKSSYNLNNLKKFEKDFNVNLWLDLFSERSFYKYWVEFHKFSKEEIFSITERSIDFFINIFKKYEPKLVLTQFVGENISNLLLYRIAKKMDVRILMPHVSYIHNKIIMTNNFISKEISDEYKKIILDFDDDSEKYNEKFIKQKYVAETVNIILNFNYNTTTFSQKINHFIKRLSNDPEPIYKNIGKTKLKMLIHRFKNNFRIKSREKFLYENSNEIIEEEKFIYFPLTSEPEAYKLITTPFYSNQVTFVENVAKSIPIDTVLYVKEHPVQKIKSWRDIKDYKKIIDIPNVKLIHPNVKSQELISKCQAVISVGGATGFEALFYKKPVIVFADEHYDELSAVTKVRKLLQLPDYIKKSMSQFKHNNKQLNALMKAYDIHCITVPLASMTKDGVVLSSIQRHGNNSDVTLENFNKFHKNYEKYFKLMAEKCCK